MQHCLLTKKMSRIHLTLKDKIKVLKQFKVGKSSRNIAKEFGVGF